MDIHIREKDTQNKTVACIFHFTVPATSNAAGLPWSEVLLMARDLTPLMPENDSAENSQIEAGTVYENREIVRFSTVDLTNAQRIAEIRAAYNERKTTVFNTLAAELDFFGSTLSAEV